MKKLIYIKDTIDQAEVPLKNILSDIGDLGNKYIWSIWELEAVGDLKGTQTYPEIENHIKQQTGYCLSWNELKELASKFDQVINAVIVASEDKNSISAHKNDFDHMFENFPLVVAILDGNFWEVSTSEEDLVNKLKSKYEDIEIKDI